MFTAFRHDRLNKDASKAMGLGGLTDALILSVAWALVAVIAGLVLAVAAIAFRRKVRETDYDFARGYNAMAPLLQRP